jgi:hypothetical protein
MTQLAETNSQQLTAPARARAPLPMGNRGIELESFESLYRFAQCIAASPFAPKGMEAPEAIVVAIQLGMELGLSPMAALQNVAVVNGRPSIYGDAALALVRASGKCESYTQSISGEGDARTASVTSKRTGEQALTHTFSVAEAKKAGLWGKAGPWTQYPERMLLFRARGFNLRDNFGDVLKGLATKEEADDIDERPIQGLVIERPEIATNPVPALPSAPEAAPRSRKRLPKPTAVVEATPETATPTPTTAAEAPATPAPVIEAEAKGSVYDELRQASPEIDDAARIRILARFNLCEPSAKKLEDIAPMKVQLALDDLETFRAEIAA